MGTPPICLVGFNGNSSEILKDLMGTPLMVLEEFMEIPPM
jgi:hypothetical protein